MMKLTPIECTCKTALDVSVWAFDKPFAQAGETVWITGVIVAHATNPLYEVRNGADKTSAIHRRLLVECGAVEPIG